MSQSSSRHTKRAIKAVSKRAASKLARKNEIDVSKEVSLDPTVQGTKIVALEHAISKLVEVQAINHREIINAFNLADAHLWVLKQICKDIVAGTVMMAAGSTPAVNMEVYYDLYNAFLAQQQEAAAKAAKKTGVNAAPEPQEEDQDVFGGDLSNADSERDEEPVEGQGTGEVSDDEGSSAVAVPQMQDAGVAGAGA